MNESITPPKPGQKPDMELIKQAGAMKSTIIGEMKAEAEKLNLTLSEEKVTLIDIRKQMIATMGLIVTGPNVATVPQDKLMSRPAGKYVTVELGPDEIANRSSHMQMRELIKSKQLKIKGTTFYEYSAINSNGGRRLVVPVE